MISRIRKKFANLSKTHKLHKSIGMIVLMLENGTSLNAIGKLLNIEIQSVDDIVRIILNRKDNSKYNYNHMKMGLAYQDDKTMILKKLISGTSYSVILLSVSICMVVFYSMFFYPIMSNMAIDLGLSLNTLRIQNLAASYFLSITVLIILSILLLILFYRVFPEISKLLVLKKIRLVRIVTTLLTLEQYAISYGYTLNHDETMQDIRLLHRKQYIHLQAQHIDQNVKSGNLIFQGHSSWMIDSYLSMITSGLTKINVESVVASYRIIAINEIDVLIKRYSAILKVLVVVCVVLVIYIFYSSLMMPLNAMEVL